jgi:hypothetical protein
MTLAHAHVLYRALFPDVTTDLEVQALQQNLGVRETFLFESVESIRPLPITTRNVRIREAKEPSRLHSYRVDAHAFEVTGQALRCVVVRGTRSPGQGQKGLYACPKKSTRVVLEERLNAFWPESEKDRTFLISSERPAPVTMDDLEKDDLLSQPRSDQLRGVLRRTLFPEL